MINLIKLKAPHTLIPILALLTACSSEPTMEPDAKPDTGPKTKLDTNPNTIPNTSHNAADNTTSMACKVYDTSNWQAKLDKVHGEDRKYRLSINADADLPSPAHSVSWRMGITDRAYPPGQRIILTTEKPKDTFSAQVITSKAIAFEAEVPFSAYSHVSIYCGERLLKRIENIAGTSIN